MKYFDESVSVSAIKERREAALEKERKERLEQQLEKISRKLLELTKTDHKDDFTVDFKILPELQEELENLGYVVSSMQDRGSGYWTTHVSM